MKVCPNCESEEIDREEVDVGVGVVCGPWGCFECGWSEDPEYDLSNGQSEIDEESGWLKDPLGGLTPRKQA